MPIASRRTLLPLDPPCRPVSTAKFLAILAAIIGLAWLWNPYWGLGLSIFTSLLCIVGKVAVEQERKRQRRVAEARRADGSICAFVRSFEYRRTDTRVIRAVFEALQPEVNFPLRASDSFANDLRLDGDDLEMDVAPAIERRTGRSLAHAKSNPHFGKVNTVADLVHFFCAQPVVR